MKRVFLTLVAMAVVVAASAQDLQVMFNEGAEAYKNKDYATAAAKFESVIDQGMDDESAAGVVATSKEYLPKSYFMLGGGRVRVGDFEAARTNFGKAAELAELYGDMTEMTKAQQWYGRTYELQGGKLFNDKNFSEALPIFEKGYASDSRNAKMANWLGICYCETGDFDKGMEVFAKVAAMGSNPRYKAEADEANENMATYTNNRVAKLQETKDYDGVIALADDMLSKNPNSAIAAKIRLQAYSNKGDHNKVIALANDVVALQTSPEEQSNIYFILGASYNAKEMRDQAIATFKKVTAGPNAATAAATVKELSE